MSTHAKVRTSWLATQPVLHGEFAALDFGQFDSISCSGGTYAPAAVITVGGAGMTLLLVGGNVVDGSLTIDPGGSFGVSPGTTAAFGGTTTFLNTSVTNWATGSVTTWQGSASAEFQNGTSLILDSGSELQVSGAAFFHSGSFTEFDGSVSITAVFTVANTATFTVSSLATFTGAVVHSGATSLQSVSIQGASVISAPVSMSGSGQILSRIGFGLDAAMTWSKSTTDVVIIPNGVLTSPRTYVLDTVGAMTGSSITFSNHDTSGSDVSVRTPGAVLIGVLSVIAGHGYHWFDLIFDGTSWEILRFSEV